MGTPMRIATYALALVVVFIAAWEIGSRVRPLVGVAAETPTAGHADDSEHGTPSDHGDQHDTTTTPQQPEGLASTVDGYQLTLLTPRPTAGTKTEIRLLISDPDGRPVTAYEVEHGKRLHLIVVRRDLASFQHVHPVLDPQTGVWATTLDTSEAGTYRVYADTAPAGHAALTLGADLSVAGAYDPEPPATEAVRTADVNDYTVTLTGDVRAGQTGTLTATVSKNGQPVTDLDPYLEAYGHLVALRQDDLAYLHVHPDGHPGDGRTPAGPTIDFAVAVPTPGTYRLFLDFQHDGVVRTTPFVLTVER